MSGGNGTPSFEEGPDPSSASDGKGGCRPANILLTGRPGVGKTTVIEQVASIFGKRAGGILTREIRERGRRTGFSIESLDGEKRVLAARSRPPLRVPAQPRVGPYAVDVGNLEAVGLPAIRRAIEGERVVIIDEIGKMELISPAFRAMITRALDSPVPVVATLGIAVNPFMEVIRRRSDVRLIEVTPENRDELPAEVAALIEEGG